MDRPFDRALGQLTDLSLVERVSGGAAIRVHPLVRDFVTRRPDPEALSALQAEAAARLASALDDTGRLEREFSARGVGGLLGDLDLAVAWSTAPSPARGSADELRRVLERERLHFPPGPGSADGLPPDFLQQMHYRSHLMGLGHLSDRLCRTAMERIGLFLVGVGVSGTDDMALVRSMKLERREETS